MLTILGVTVSDKLSVSVHVQQAISASAQTLHAFKNLLVIGLGGMVIDLNLRTIEPLNYQYGTTLYAFSLVS